MRLTDDRAALGWQTCGRAKRVRWAVRRARPLVWLWLVGAVGSWAFATTPAVLVDRQLHQQQVQIQSLSEGVLTYFDADRQLQSEPMNRFVLIRDIGPPEGVASRAEAGSEQGVIETTDGQRLVGRWVGAEEDESGNRVKWRHAVFGDVAISLEKIRRVTLADDGVEAEPTTDGTDYVALTNGDVVAGYIRGVRSEGVAIQLEGQREAVELPIDRVRQMGLTGSSTERLVNRHSVWLRDGSRVFASAIVIMGGQVEIESELAGGAGGRAGVVRVSLTELERVVLASSEGYLVDLADLPMRVVGGGSVFGLGMPPRWVKQELWLHGPVRVEFELPPGAERLVARVGLSEEREGDLSWADCEVAVGVDGRVLGGGRVNAKTSEVQINQAIQGAGLFIDVGEAGNGPIQDRLILRGAVLFVRFSAGSGHGRE